jgi:hypothetical protein
MSKCGYNEMRENLKKLETGNFNFVIKMSDMEVGPVESRCNIEKEHTIF